MRRWENRTAYQSFHGRVIEGPKDRLQQISKLIYVNGQRHNAKNAKAWITACRELCAEVENIALGTYNSVEMHREQENRRRNHNTIRVYEYSPGDWVKVSVRDVPKHHPKGNSCWVGPAHVVSTEEHSVVKVQFPDGEEKTVRCVRCWFYDGSSYVPHEHMDRIYRAQLGHLEVEDIVELKIRNNQWVEFSGKDSRSTSMSYSRHS